MCAPLLSGPCKRIEGVVLFEMASDCWTEIRPNERAESFGVAHDVFDETREQAVVKLVADVTSAGPGNRSLVVI